MLTIIVVMDFHGGISNNKKLPIEQDGYLDRVNKLTECQPVIMGRKTFELFGKFPNRPNIVLTRNEKFNALGCHVVGTIGNAIEKAIERLSDCWSNDIFIIGGVETFREFMPLCKKILLTYIYDNLPCDKVFPEGIPTLKKWNVKSRLFNSISTNDYSFDFITLIRRGVIDTAIETEPSSQVMQDHPTVKAVDFPPIG